MRILVVVVLFYSIGHAIPNDLVTVIWVKTANKHKGFIGRKPKEMWANPIVALRLERVVPSFGRITPIGIR
jgi:hypothetical protein